MAGSPSNVHFTDRAGMLFRLRQKVPRIPAASLKFGNFCRYSIKFNFEWMPSDFRQFLQKT